jgi:penicillin G amidase
MNMHASVLGGLGRLAAWPSRQLLPGTTPERLHRYGVDATIARDERGIPWITASCEEDLCFAAGFAQACDRLWQMDLLRRRALGTLSEVFGSKTITQDVRVRRLAIHRVARVAETVLSARGRVALESFCNGVNAAIRRMARHGALPPEFLVLRYRPASWTALDSLAIVKMLGYDLSKNLANEAFRARLVRDAPAYAKSFLEPKYPADVPPTIWPDGSRPSHASRPAPDSEGTGPLMTPTRGQRAAEPSRVTESWPGVPMPAADEGSGSNAWVLAGSRTASGSPLLANDPHIGFSQPSLWYQAGLRLTDGPRPCAGYGVTVPGLPGLICGANQSLAFGITNATVDTQDLCVAAPGKQLPGHWAERSVIKVRRGEDVPVDSAGARGCAEIDIPELPNERWLLFWSGYQPSAEIDGSLRAWQAQSYGEFRDALRHFGVPVLNYLVACTDGTIALKTAGCIPRRRPGSGLLPADYAEVARSWQSFLSFEELPETVNPPQGYIVSANNKLLADDDGPQLAVDWGGAYRAPRIHELIREGGQVTASDCARWQMDVKNARARRLLPVLLPALSMAADPSDQLTAACIGLLREWDGHDRPELAAPLIFSGLLTDLTADWAGCRLGADLADAMPDLSHQIDHLILDATARGVADLPGTLGSAALGALTRTATRLAADLGDDPRRWRNDRAHVIADGHLLGRTVKSLAPLFGCPNSPTGTSRYSVRLMFPGPNGIITEGAPWRFVAETRGDGCSMWDVLRHGSSGHPLSPHYDDQTLAHAQGRLTEVKPGFRSGAGLRFRRGAGHCQRRKQASRSPAVPGPR